MSRNQVTETLLSEAVRRGTRAYMQLSCLAKRQPVGLLLRRLEETQWLPPSQVRALSSAVLGRLIQWSTARCPHYAPHRTDPGTMPTLQDFPVLEKHDLRQCADALLASGKASGFRWDRTSGSTGQPLRVAHDDRFLAWNQAGQWRGRGWVGVRPGDRIMTLWGRALDHSLQRRIRPTQHILRNYRTIPAFDLSDESMDAALDLFRSFGPHLVYGYSTALYRFALRCREKGRGLRRAVAALRGIQYTAETLFDYQKRQIQEVFQCPVLSEYGCTETGAFAFECSAGGLHLSTENVVVEFLDLEHRESVPGGSVVVTVLHNRVMPLIRYRVGDMGCAVDGRCSCGRSLPLMRLLQAKEIDMIHTPDGRVVSSELFDYINLALIDRGLEAVKSFQVVQTGSQEFFVQIEGWASEQVTRYWEQRMREAIGETISVRFEYVSRIPPDPSGKLRYFRRENG